METYVRVLIHLALLHGSYRLTHGSPYVLYLRKSFDTLGPLAWVPHLDHVGGGCEDKTGVLTVAHRQHIVGVTIQRKDVLPCLQVPHLGCAVWNHAHHMTEVLTTWLSGDGDSREHYDHSASIWSKSDHLWECSNTRIMFTSPFTWYVRTLYALLYQTEIEHRTINADTYLRSTWQSLDSLRAIMVHYDIHGAIHGSTFTAAEEHVLSGMDRKDCPGVSRGCVWVHQGTGAEPCLRCHLDHTPVTQMHHNLTLLGTWVFKDTTYSEQGALGLLQNGFWE